MKKARPIAKTILRIGIKYMNLTNEDGKNPVIKVAGTEESDVR